MGTNQSLSALLGDVGLDPNATAAMQLTVEDVGAAIQAGLGDVTIDDITTSEVLLVSLLVDDSISIDYGGNAQAIRDGHNQLVDALMGAKSSAAVLISCGYINGKLLYPYVMLDQAVQMDARNFRPGGGTPLYRQTEIVLTTVAAKMAEFEQGGVAARAITVILTDGGDNSGPVAPRTTRAMVEGLLKTEQHIVAGVGVNDGYTDFHAVFAGMGIMSEWVLTPGNSPSEIRKVFRVISQSAIRASQTTTFSQTAMGGFGN